MSDRERSVAGNWLHEKIFRTEKLSDLLALSPCIEAGKCPHDRTNGDKNDKHCACQQQKDCVYHNRRVITERRCRFPKHHYTKRNHQLSFQQGNPTKNGILAKQIIKAETEIAITANEITDLLIEMIKILSKQYKKLTIVTNHIEKLRKIEKEIKEKEGILIILSNNKNKSLLKSQVIINMDFNQELINQYKIYEEAIIINAEENIKIEAIRFNGIVINDYEIEIGRKEFIWRDGIEKYRQRDLIEAELYVRDTYKNIRKKIQKNNIKIKELYGINGIVKI